MSDDTKLGRELADLERTNPEVRAAAEAYDRMRDSIVHKECRADLAAARQRIAELERERDAALADGLRLTSGAFKNLDESRAALAIAREALEAIGFKPKNRDYCPWCGYAVAKCDGRIIDCPARVARAALARLASPLGSGAGAPVPTVCASWCGDKKMPPAGRDAWFLNGRYFCTTVCERAGRPLHPATPGER